MKPLSSEPLDVDPDALAPLLQVMADGQPRSVEELTRKTGAEPASIERGLALLAAAGLKLRHADDRLSCAPFAALDAVAIEAACVCHSLFADVHVAALTDSTNSRLLQAARNGALDAPMTIFATELQSAGRGRMGRSWVSAPGSSLTVSFALSLKRAASMLSGLPLACGLAVRDALLAHGVEAELKWPNDLLAGHGKVGGILVEIHAPSRTQSIVVIGVGLNVYPDAERAHALASRENALPSTDLLSAGAVQPLDRNQLIADIANGLALRLERFASDGFEPMVSAWNAAHAFQDAEVSLIEGGATLVRGIARGTDTQGRLLVETSEGMRTVVVGDVSVRSSA
jgi:BirA family biotin operon repressor/biotin-[acetyl-CoA-carboxylase] ligase